MTAYNTGGQTEKICFRQFSEQSTIAMVNTSVPADEVILSFENNKELSVLDFGPLKAVCLKSYEAEARHSLETLQSALLEIGLDLARYFDLDKDMRSMIIQRTFPAIEQQARSVA